MLFAVKVVIPWRLIPISEPTPSRRRPSDNPESIIALWFEISSWHGHWCQGPKDQAGAPSFNVPVESTPTTVDGILSTSTLTQTDLGGGLRVKIQVPWMPPTMASVCHPDDVLTAVTVLLHRLQSDSELLTCWISDFGFLTCWISEFLTSWMSDFCLCVSNLSDLSLFGTLHFWVLAFLNSDFA